MRAPAFLIDASRRRGHRYYYHNGAVCSRSAYACVRCGELDRPIESLPFAPDWDDDYPDGLNDDAAGERAGENRARRWLSFLPFPRWL